MADGAQMNLMISAKIRASGHTFRYSGTQDPSS